MAIVIAMTVSSNGKELARISRFFLMGLSSFQRGCAGAEQTFRIGAGATFIRQFLLAALPCPPSQKGRIAYATEFVGEQEIESRLHDLTLDFGVVSHAAMSRPLQTRVLGEWKLELWVPKALGLSEVKAAQAFEEHRLPLVLAEKELAGLGVLSPPEPEALLVCDSFLEARAAMDRHRLAALLPDYLAPSKISKSFTRVLLPMIDSRVYHFYLAWNPRLLRLNPQAIRRRDLLAESFTHQIGG